MLVVAFDIIIAYNVNIYQYMLFLFIYDSNDLWEFTLYVLIFKIFIMDGWMIIMDLIFRNFILFSILKLINEVILK